MKGLGIVRILSEQRPSARVLCRWERGLLVLESDLTLEDLLAFFLEEYAPTPFVSPWNGGSGFFFQEGKSQAKGADGKKLKTGVRDQATEATRALTAVQQSSGRRLARYREIIGFAKEQLRNSLRESAPADEEKLELVRLLRNAAPDHILDWIDAAFVISGEKLVPPPLLLSGGNEGNLDFSNTFIQNLLVVFDGNLDTPTVDSRSWLEGSIFLEPAKIRSESSSGYFNPGVRGGANATTGFSAKSYTNPWDFILTMEGIVLFTANATKKLASHRYETSFPFCVKPSAGGYASGESKEAASAKAEIWLPTWSRSTSYSELRHVFGEGRANIRKRSARSGVDFALAVTSLGVDRGLDSFYRYGILPRFGDSFFGSVLQHINVRREPIVTDLLASSDEWLARFLREASGEKAPASIKRTAGRLEAAIFAQAASPQEGDRDVAQELLIALGECERVLAGSEKWRGHEEANVSPIPWLPVGWLTSATSNSAEFRLAASLASLRPTKGSILLRQQLEPVTPWASWDDEPNNEVVWHEGAVTDVLIAMMERRLLLAKSASADSWPEFARVTAWPSDIAAFIEGRIDEARFAELLWGLSLVDFSQEIRPGERPVQPDAAMRDEMPSAFYSQLKLCFAGRLPNEKRVPVEPVIFHRAAAGDGTRASEQALRRLHGSSIPVLHLQIPLNGEAARRCAAALLFPLWDSQLAQVCRPIAPEFFPEFITKP
jgi:CRISPR-associated protein Csx17